MSQSFSVFKAIPKPASQIPKLKVGSYDRESRIETKATYVSQKIVPKLSCTKIPTNNSLNGYKSSYKSKSPKPIIKINRNSEKKKDSSLLVSKIPLKKKSFNYNYSCTTNDLSLLNDIVSKNEFNHYDSSFIDTDKNKEKPTLQSKSASKCQVAEDRKFSILDIQDSNSHNQSPPHSIGKSQTKFRQAEKLKQINSLPLIKNKCALILSMSR